MSWRTRCAMCFIAIVTCISPLRAEDTIFTVPIRANYDFNLLGGTSLNPPPNPDTGYIPFSALGEFTFELDASLNDPSEPTTVPFVNVTGILQGTAPAMFLPHFISPNVEFIGGELTNIVRDGDGEVVSGEVVNLEMKWELVGLPGGPLDGVTGVTGGNSFDPTSNLPFNGSISAIPFAKGDFIFGPDVGHAVNEDFEFFRTDQGGMELVTLGRKRFLTVVPEPLGGSAMAILVVGCAIAVRRNRLLFMV